MNRRRRHQKLPGQTLGALVIAFIVGACASAPPPPTPQVSYEPVNAAGNPVTSAAPAPANEFEVAGIPVIFKRVEANEVIAVRLYMKGGSANLSPDQAGIDQLLGEVSTRGTERFSREEFTNRLDAAGAEIGADASHDYAVWALQTVEAHWDEAWELFAQAVRHPSIPPDELELVRAQLLSGLNQRRDDADAYLSLLSDSVLYAGHPYATDPSGTLASVRSITRQQLLDWHRQRLAKDNLVMVIVGNVARPDLESKVREAFGSLPAEGLAPQTAGPVPARAWDVTVVERPLPTNYIAGLFPAPPPDHPDYPALRVATDVLSDRLFEEVRTKRNLSYAVYATLGKREANYGTMYVTATEPGRTVKVMLDEVRRLQRESLDANLLRRAAISYSTQYWAGQETNMAQAAELGSAELLGGGWENAQRFVERIAAVTPQDIRRVAREYIKDMQFVVIGDPGQINRADFRSP